MTLPFGMDESVPFRKKPVSRAALQNSSIPSIGQSLNHQMAQSSDHSISQSKIPQSPLTCPLVQGGQFLIKKRVISLLAGWAQPDILGGLQGATKEKLYSFEGRKMITTTKAKFLCLAACLMWAMPLCAEQPPRAELITAHRIGTTSPMASARCGMPVSPLPDHR